MKSKAAGDASYALKMAGEDAEEPWLTGWRLGASEALGPPTYQRRRCHRQHRTEEGAQLGPRTCRVQRTAPEGRGLAALPLGSSSLKEKGRGGSNSQRSLSKLTNQLSGCLRHRKKTRSWKPFCSLACSLRGEGSCLVSALPCPGHLLAQLPGPLGYSLLPGEL